MSRREKVPPTPTTEQIRSWACHVPTTSVNMRWSEESAAGFARWLAAHDAEVAAAAVTAYRDAVRRYMRPDSLTTWGSVADDLTEWVEIGCPS